MYILTLKKGEEKRNFAGHPWVYANEVGKIEGYDKQGSIAKVQSYEGKLIGYGYINHLSKIIVRLLSRDETPIDQVFFYNRIKQANDFRKSLGYKNNYRVVFGESDLLPGLIVDKYSDYLSVQFLTLGMEVRKEMLVEILVDLFKPKGIYERSDVSVRKKEGLKEVKGLLYGAVPPKVIVEENGLKIEVDIINGQKTGYFLDQKENRDNLKHYVKGKAVLDCFCNVGGFSLCASKYGAREITALDISLEAIEQVKRNAIINGYANINAVQTDVFEEMRKYKKEQRKFDVIILDPPAFTKSKDTVKAGYHGYRDINMLALKQINKGGYLITCSCSQHLSLNLFLEMIKESVATTGVNVKLVELRTQGKDHATLIGTDEAMYLKVAVLHII
ncbi:MAG: class I SAM-dependent rRNA methyltransferase [Bacilli bacterium]|jgi:23S rRNA (cytosine1962-C5)-methyltransferase|nr:class I SAM-dependent rRNA methyltransferase [Bacilli bacterium]HHU24054.1 class I SAM-dependent rRNA methyltransferase [Acholeplasmataceae bacterium]